MKPGQLLVYLIVFIAVGLFFYLYEVRLAEKDQELEAAKARIFDLKADQIGAVRYKSGGIDFQLVKEGRDDWRISEPLDTPADKREVEEMIRLVLAGKKDRVFAEPVHDLAQFGLDKPAVALTFMSGGRALAPTLNIGQKNPAGQLCYANLGNSRQVFTVVSSLGQGLTKSLFDLREKSLVLFSGEKIDRLRIVGRNEVALEKERPGRWRLTSPETGRADNDEVQKIIFRALKGRVKRFAEPLQDQAEYGFDRPRVRVWAYHQGRVAAEVVVGRAEMKVKKADGSKASDQEQEIEGYWVRTTERPEIMLISEEMAQDLDLTADRLKDRHVMDLDRHQTTGLEITGRQARLKAEKKDGFWEIIESSATASRDLQIDSLLASLEELKWVRKLDSTPETIKECGLDRPDLTIRLNDRAGKTTSLAASVAEVQEKMLALRVGTGPVVLVEKDELMKRLPKEVRPDQGAS